MGEYKVKDPQALLDQAGNIAQMGQNILRINEELAGYCNQISNAWQSDTVDKESYLKVLQQNLAKVETLVAALRALSNNLSAYAQREIQNMNS